MFKAIIMNSKGGVGKSTVAMQLITPYLYKKFNKIISYHEFDDENQDCKSYVESSIVKSVCEDVVLIDLKDRITDILVEDDSPVVIDVGANKSTTYFFDGLKKSGMIITIDLIVIPMMDGESDAISAINLYNKIREISKTVKIIFALNRVNTNRNLHAQYNIFLGDPRVVFNDVGLIDQIEPVDQNVIEIIDSDAIKYSKNYGLTAYELATMPRDVNEELKTAIIGNASKQMIKMLSFKRAVQEDCKEFYNSYLIDIFDTIDSVLDGDNNFNGETIEK